MAIATPSSITPTDDEIRGAATAYRAALERIDAVHWMAAAISAFPRGACGHASEMLGRYLRSVFKIEADYILRDFYAPDGEWLGGHAWLEWNGLIIDITGDQFGWEYVIVSRNSAQHEAGRPELRQPLTGDDRWWGIYCARAHQAALEMLTMPTIDPQGSSR